MEFKSNLLTKIAERMKHPANTIEAPIKSVGPTGSINPQEKKTGTKTISASPGTETMKADSLSNLKKLAAATKNRLESKSLSKQSKEPGSGQYRGDQVKDTSQMQGALDAAVYRKSESVYAENKNNFARTLSGLKRPGYGDELKHTSPT